MAEATVHAEIHNETSEKTSRPASRTSSALKFLRGSRHASPVSVHSNVDSKQDKSDYHSIEGLQPLTDNEREKMNFTRSNPLGRILLDMHKDSVNMADKSGLHELSRNLISLCEDFYESMAIEREMIRSEMKGLAKQVENSILNKELNSHLLNQDFKAPTEFSSKTVICTPGERAECMRVFSARGQKFSGNADSPSIIEFLNSMKSAQEICCLSEREFIDFMLLNTTGKAHGLMIDWIAQGKNVDALFHSLMIYYDRRISPEDAKTQLQNIKASRQENLSRLEARIMTLATRACSVMPVGNTQTACFNTDAVIALIRSLPAASAIIAQNNYHLLSAKMGRACTFDELTKALNIYRGQIDMDIKREGVDTGDRPEKKKWGKNKDNWPKNRQFSTYGVSVQPNKGGAEGGKRKGKEVTNGNKGENKGNWNNKGKTSGYKNNNSNGYQGNNYPRPNKGNPNINGNYCSLCGHNDHRAANGCPFMQADNGTLIKVLPTHSTCNRCPHSLPHRLNHPQQICPYRLGGPLYGTA